LLSKSLFQVYTVKNASDLIRRVLVMPGNELKKIEKPLGVLDIPLLQAQELLELTVLSSNYQTSTILNGSERSQSEMKVAEKLLANGR